MGWGTDKEWLAGLKAGDPVAIYHSGGWSAYYELRTVERATKTFVVVGYTKYRRKDGYQIGGSYRRDSIEPVTQKVRDHIEREELRNEYRALFKKLDVKVDWKEAPELRIAIDAMKIAVKAFEDATAKEDAEEEMASP